MEDPAKEICVCRYGLRLKQIVRHKRDSISHITCISTLDYWSHVLYQDARIRVPPRQSQREMALSTAHVDYFSFS
jgi:hypothetical protein